MKKLVLTLVLSLTMSFAANGLVLAAPTAGDEEEKPQVSASTTAAKNEVCAGVSSQFGGSCTSGGTDVTRIVKVILEILSWIAGIAAVIMIVVAGLRYITSGGDSSAISGAKNSLIYALVGVVIVALSQVIVIFILHNATPPPPPPEEEPTSKHLSLRHNA